MPREINLRAAFGEPEETLKRVGVPHRILPTGLMPNYRIGDYRSNFELLGIDHTHLQVLFDERRFQRGLVAARFAADQGGLGIFAVHVPRTRYNNFSVSEAFMHAQEFSTTERPASGGILPLYVVTKGQAYTHREDNLAVKHLIEDDGYDGTEAALAEGRALGAVTVLLRSEAVHQDIQDVFKELKAGKLPSRRV